MYSNSMLDLCAQSELWRLCANEVKHNDYGIYDTSAQAARQSESPTNAICTNCLECFNDPKGKPLEAVECPTCKALPKTQTLPDP